MVVGFEMAKILKRPLDVVVVRKIGAPYEPELAIGAVAQGEEVLDAHMASELDPRSLKETIEREKLELKRREQLYRGGRPPLDLKAKTAIVVDDGLATGYTAQAAIKAVKKLHPSKIIFAAPVCARDSIVRIEHEVSKIVCILLPHDLQAIGLYFRTFPQVSDEEVMQLLKKSKQI